MSFYKQFSIMMIAGVLLTCAACGDNLLPSGEDKRPTIQAGSSGGGVGQKAPDFTVTDSNGTTVTLASSLAGHKGAVYYFTMWCPICDVHMSSMRSSIAPLFPGVNFYLVDYVSGSVSGPQTPAPPNAISVEVLPTWPALNLTLEINFKGTLETTVFVNNIG